MKCCDISGVYFTFDLDRFTFISFVAFSTRDYWASSFFCTNRQVAGIDIYLNSEFEHEGKDTCSLSRVLARLNYTCLIENGPPSIDEPGAELLGELYDLLGRCRLLTMLP
jgi:hypothetical protein